MTSLDPARIAVACAYYLRLRVLPFLAACAIVAVLPTSVLAQSATLSGVVVDDSDAPVPEVRLTLVNDRTALRRVTTSGTGGTFALAVLPPGRYTLRAEHDGFAPVDVSAIQLSANDQVAITVRLRLASVSETVEVGRGVRPVSTSPTVATVVTREAVEQLPLNGRSFHALLELTPGVSLFRSGNTTYDGQFVANGQRANANAFMVDGVSANVGINPRSSFSAESGAGALPALSVLGTTSNLVAVDAMEEFRVQTSTFAPEFGRSPGAQVSIVTRSGTNALHGSAFEYWRDDALDANDWFANSRGVAKPPLRQHDFGGTLGGPLLRNRLFFFGSYEGLRLDQPQVNVTSVPSLAARAAAPAATRPLLEAFPRPTGADLGAGAAEFAASYADPSRLDSTGLRLDGRAGAWQLFGRWSEAPSRIETRTLSRITETRLDTRSATAGATRTIGARTIADVRVNWSRSVGESTNRVDDFGGATPMPTAALFPAAFSPETATAIVSIGALTYRDGAQVLNQQRQINLVSTLTQVRGSHQLKAGVDWRRLTPELISTSTFQVSFTNIAQASAGTASSAIFNTAAIGPTAIIDNLSLFAQDTWTIAPALTLTYGLRWDYAPAPGERDDRLPAVVQGVSDPQTMTLAPEGTKLWSARTGRVTPRVGAAWQISDRPGQELVLRGGAGLFASTSMGPLGNAYAVFPYSRQRTIRPAVYPEVLSSTAPPLPGREAPYGQIWTFVPDIELPGTWQWNATIERAFGATRTLTASYVGATSDTLLRTENILPGAGVNPAFGSTVNVVRNEGWSRYDALQVQFVQRLWAGINGQLAYTLADARDNGSADSSVVAGQASGTGAPGARLDPRIDDGPSDYDVRHQFSAGVSWTLPTPRGGSIVRGLAGGWGVDAFVRARSGFPLTPTSFQDLGYGFYSFRPDAVSGAPLWIEDAALPGGRRLNRAAFVVAPGRQGTVARNSLRGFGASQVDLALRRQFTVSGPVRVQVRAEYFNIFNTANFADPMMNLDSPQFGLATQTLNRGLGGLNALYQFGGPRSGQISIRLLF